MNFYKKLFNNSNIRKNNNCKIVYIFDDSFHSQFFTVTNSILKNEKKESPDSIEFYITYFGKRDRIIDLLKGIKLNFPNNKFYLKHIESEFPDLWKKYENLYDYEKSADHIQTSSVLCRFDLHTIWPGIDGKIIYLDLDLIVKGSISELFDLSNSDKIIQACRTEQILASEVRTIAVNKPKPNEFYLNYFRRNVEYIYYRYIQKTSSNAKLVKEILEKEYNLAGMSFNAGVLILDLTKFRQDKKLKEHINFLMTLNKDGFLFRHNDQSIFNIAFYNQVGFIDPAWNCLDYGWETDKNLCESRLRNNVYVRKSFLEGKIIHYNGPQKPWDWDPDNPVTNYFLESVELWKKYVI